jgi:hypothetical protein
VGYAEGGERVAGRSPLGGFGTDSPPCPPIDIKRQNCAGRSWGRPPSPWERAGVRVLHLHAESCRGRNHNNLVTSASGSQEVSPSPPSPSPDRARPYPNLSRATRKPFSAMRSFSKPAQRVRQPGFPSPFRPHPQAPLPIGRGVTHRTLVSSNREWPFHSAVDSLNAYALPTPRASHSPVALTRVAHVGRAALVAHAHAGRPALKRNYPAGSNYSFFSSSI